MATLDPVDISPTPQTGGAPVPEVTLISRYRLDNGSAADDVGTVHGTVVGTWTSTDRASMVSGVAGTSMYKAGGTPHITLPASHAAHALPELSLTLYYQPAANTNKHILFACAPTTGNVAGDFSLERLTNGRLRCWHVGQDGALRFFESTDGVAATNLVVGTAYRVTLTLGPAGAMLYLNGSLVSSITQNLNGWNNARVKYVGIWTDGAQAPAEGVFDHITIRRGQLAPSGEAALSVPVSVTLPDPDPGPDTSYTPFPFVTVSNPTVTHAGVTARPGYNATTPMNAAVTDPMTGIQIVRIGGNSGAAVMINGTTDSGLVFPQRLRNENSPRMGNVCNADGSLVAITRRFAVTGDPGSACNSYIVDTTGDLTGARFRIVRASGTTGFGEAGQWWFWDPNNARRAFIVRDNGQVEEWWPVGGQGHAVGERNVIRGPTAGFASHNQGRRHMINCSWDGQFYISGCLRTSDGRWGGIRINLQTGALGTFIPTPDTFNVHSDRSSQGTSATGLYTSFSPDGARHRFGRADTGAIVSDTGDSAMSHIDMTIVNGIEYAIGGHTTGTGFRLFRIDNGTFTTKASGLPMANPQHTGCTNTRDLFETYGGTGSGATTGNRYAIFTKSNDRDGHSRGIMGIRLGPTDNGQIRFICNHRSNRTTNANEVHAQISSDGRLLVFPSNWAQPGVTTDGHVHPYVALIPSGWWSPNNNGT